jgi:hypothetical protein
VDWDDSRFLCQAWKDINSTFSFFYSIKSLFSFTSYIFYDHNPWKVDDGYSTNTRFMKQKQKSEQKARDEKKARAEKEKLAAAEKAKREARKLKEQQDGKARKEKEHQAQVKESLAEDKVKEAVRLKSEQSQPSTSTHEETNTASKQKQLSAPSPAQKLEDARRKLNEIKAAEGAKTIEIAGADSNVVIKLPPSPDITIDLLLINGFPRIQISGPSVSKESGSSSSSNSSRASSSTQKNLPSTSVSKDASMGPSKSSNSSTSAQKQVLASTAKSLSSSTTKTDEDLEDEKEEKRNVREASGDNEGEHQFKVFNFNSETAPSVQSQIVNVSTQEKDQGEVR